MRRLRAHRPHEAGVTSVALAMLILFTFLGMTATVYMLVSAGSKRARAQENSNRALLIAQGRIERAKYLIMSAAASLDTADDNLINGNDYVAGHWVTAESQADGKLMIYGNLRTATTDPKMQDHFVVRASGIYKGSYRVIEARLGYLSFLKFARFVEGSLTYGTGAVLTGMIYAKGNINVPSGAGGPHVIFKRDVTTTGTITPKGSVIVAGHQWANVRVDGKLEENSAKSYSVNVPAQFAFYQSLAQSSSGLYISSANQAKLGNGLAQVSGNTGDNLIDLTLFKNLGTAAAFYDANSSGAYESASDIDLPDAFNGVVYYNGTNKPHVKGELTGQNLSIFANQDILVDGSITTGHDANGMPVNLGLITKGNLYYSQFIPSKFEINAGIFTSDSYGTEDNDNSPYDNDNSHHWQEQTIEPKFYFKIYGPLCTANGGSNGAWVAYGTAHPGATTREWFYDVDITTFPPPFPIVEGVLMTLSYHEIESRI